MSAGQNAWKSINDFVRDHIFDVPAIAPADLTNVTEVENLSNPLGIVLLLR